jgi:hypothetical protein
MDIFDEDQNRYFEFERKLQNPLSLLNPDSSDCSKLACVENAKRCKYFVLNYPVYAPFQYTYYKGTVSTACARGMSAALFTY